MNIKSIFPIATAAIMVALLFSSLSQASAQAASSYQPCSACHLPSGQGIPGAFPPLKNRVAKIASVKEGREYLFRVIQGGLMGPISVGSQQYVGVMPAQLTGVSDQQAVDLLNYLVQELDKGNQVEGWVPFTLEEVKALAKTPSNGMSNNNLRKALLDKYPELK